MLLGQVLEELSDEMVAAETLIALCDLPLVAEIEKVRHVFGETAPAYAAGAARRFVQQATDDDWLSLMTALDRTDDPGKACLRQMLVWSLRADEKASGCRCGSACKGGSNA